MIRMITAFKLSLFYILLACFCLNALADGEVVNARELMLFDTWINNTQNNK